MAVTLFGGNAPLFGSTDFLDFEPVVPDNCVAIRIGGYQTVYPLPDETDEALSLLTAPNWAELGARLVRLQREAQR